MGDVGNDNSGDAGDEEDYTAVADALDLDKGALDPIERATDNLNGGALGEVYLVGGEVDELLIVTVADGDELIHLEQDFLRTYTPLKRRPSSNDESV